MFVLEVSCPIIYFQNQRQCVGAVQGVVVAPCVTESIPQRPPPAFNFSTGRHLAAAAGINPVTHGAVEIRLVAPCYHILFLCSILEISILVEPVPKTYENSGNTFHKPALCSQLIVLAKCVGKVI